MPRSVLVTGGSKGFGLAMARALAAVGDRVAVTCRSGKPSEGPEAVLPATGGVRVGH
ncbi:SDR family NAD(P)-dependent oxidoreductase [Streptomyces nigrescens]